MDIDTKERIAEIRRLNEQFRTTFRGGEIVLTESFAALRGRQPNSETHHRARLRYNAPENCSLNHALRLTAFVW